MILLYRVVFCQKPALYILYFASFRSLSADEKVRRNRRNRRESDTGKIGRKAFFTLKVRFKNITTEFNTIKVSQSPHMTFLKTENKSNEKFMSFYEKKVEREKGQKSPAENFSGL